LYCVQQGGGLELVGQQGDALVDDAAILPRAQELVDFIAGRDFRRDGPGLRAFGGEGGLRFFRDDEAAEEAGRVFEGRRDRMGAIQPDRAGWGGGGAVLAAAKAVLAVAFAALRAGRAAFGPGCAAWQAQPVFAVRALVARALLPVLIPVLIPIGARLVLVRAGARLAAGAARSILAGAARFIVAGICCGAGACGSWRFTIPLPLR
jgi:hypothetical protein